MTGLTDDEYRQTMDLLAGQVRMMTLLPLDQIMDTIERAHSLGSILHPAEYRDGMDRLRDQERLVRAARELVKVARSITGETADRT